MLSSATADRVAELRNGLEPQFDQPKGFTWSAADDGTVRVDADGFESGDDTDAWSGTSP